MGATLFGATSIQPSPQPTNRRRDNLAIVFQNLFTVIVRLRANRQVINDAQAFRAQMQSALRAGEKEGISKLYPPEDVRLATFAIVAFLDESILNSANPAFSDWARMPLQEEMFGHHRAGEVFFENIERLLTRGDSHGVADLLEVYSLCILLGYKGKYGLSENSPRSWTAPGVIVGLGRPRRQYPDYRGGPLDPASGGRRACRRLHRTAVFRNLQGFAEQRCFQSPCARRILGMVGD